MEFSLRRDGIAGVCGVCGERGLTGESELDTEAGATMPGTLASCLLDVLDDRCICIEDDVMDSVNWWLASFMRWNLES